MQIQLSIQQRLIETVFRVSREPTREAAATKALHAFIARSSKERLMELIGQLEWDSQFNYRRERSRL